MRIAPLEWASHRPMIAIDFFCGCGGLSRGLLDAGIDVRAGVDWDERLKATYEANNAPSRFVQADIRSLDIHAVRDALGITEADLVLYAACSPCQPFSTLNQMKGEDDRKSLLLSFVDLVEAAPPDFIFVENVPGLHNAYGREIYEEFRRRIEALGFNYTYSAQLDAWDFGVPQTRKRFILLASRLGPVKRPRRVARRATVRTALRRFPKIEDGVSHPQIPLHVARRMMPHHKQIIAAVPRNGGSRQQVADQTILLKCHQERPTVHKDVFGRMAWNAPAPTLTARCTDVYCGRFAHPEQDRGISLREAAAIQTFPDTYEFHGTFFHIAGMIGNAVPVKFARRLGDALLRSVPRVR